jgi:hypothetical protein
LNAKETVVNYAKFYLLWITQRKIEIKLNSKVETTLTADQLNTYFARKPKNLIHNKHFNGFSDDYEN